MNAKQFLMNVSNRHTKRAPARRRARTRATKTVAQAVTTRW